ncbi:B-cell receptor CD22 isoform X1 [Danio rerio]|uniref:B-cell receptor CD22 isoform X1 n=1 Tax=Danio rerio TaxID=7955 RepID=A0AC58FZJ4_DANRE
MLRSFRASLPLILVIMTAGSDGQQDWGVNYSSSSVCALKGSTVKISCTVKYPHDHQLRSVYWTKHAVTDGETPDLCSDPDKTGRVQCVRADKDTSSITLTAVTEADKHIYYCRFTTDAEGGKWTGIPGVQLDVTDLQVETQQTVVEGDSVTLSCKSSCSLPEETTFIWYRNTKTINKGIRTKNQLHLWSVSYYDAGDYQCAVGGNEHLISPAVYVKVQWVDGLLDWRVKYSPSSVCALKGSTVKISCTSTYSVYGYQLIQSVSTKPAVTGEEPPDLCTDPDKRGGIQCVREDKDTFSITLTAVTEADKHIYYCRITDTRFRWTGIPGAHLDVTGLQVETKQCVKEGDSVTLSCKSSCSLPEETTFIWYRNTERLTGETLNNQLHLQSVSRSDAGEYRCAARGKAGERLNSPSVYLSVEYPPKSVSVSVSGSAVIVSGDSVTLNCSSDSNPPALNFSWLKGESSVGSGRIFSISNISSDHSGEYKCRARNKHGEKNSDPVMLNVMYPPRNVSVFINGSAVIVSGDSVTLSCSSDSNPPAVNFTWFKENQSSAVGSGQSFSALDSGRYYCEAENKYGSQRSESVSVTEGVQRSALLTLTGVVAGCGGLIFIIIFIIVFIWKKKKRDGGAEDTRQNQQNPIGRSAETASANDSAVYSLVSANQSEDLYTNITSVKAKRSSRAEAGDVEDLQYASVHHFKNKDTKTEEHQKMEMQRPSDANRCEDVIYSSVK